MQPGALRARGCTECAKGHVKCTHTGPSGAAGATPSIAEGVLALDDITWNIGAHFKDAHHHDNERNKQLVLIAKSQRALRAESERQTDALERMFDEARHQTDVLEELHDIMRSFVGSGTRAQMHVDSGPGTPLPSPGPGAPILLPNERVDVEKPGNPNEREEGKDEDGVGEKDN